MLNISVTRIDDYLVALILQTERSVDYESLCTSYTKIRMKEDDVLPFWECWRHCLRSSAMSPESLQAVGTGSTAKIHTPMRLPSFSKLRASYNVSHISKRELIPKPIMNHVYH